jgi:hypothetical protein
MRAHQAAGFAYWLLAAIYLLAALGGALASGHVGELPVELAVRAPALLIAGPVAAGRLAQAATQARKVVTQRKSGKIFPPMACRDLFERRRSEVASSPEADVLGLFTVGTQQHKEKHGIPYLGPRIETFQVYKLIDFSVPYPLTRFRDAVPSSAQDSIGLADGFDGFS